jgi:mono/diheme cytochrome c family protein
MRRAILALGLPMALAGLAMASPGAAQNAAPNGATLYTRCAACHTATGAGVPGAFPPLKANFRQLAGTAEGRRYIQLALIRGLNGSVTIAGKTYRGVMPAQAMDDAAIAAVLNHVGTTISTGSPAFRAFTAAEVQAVRAGAAALNAQAVSRLRPATGG